VREQKREERKKGISRRLQEASQDVAEGVDAVVAGVPYLRTGVAR
jgi:hypothetical protein